MAKHIFVTGGRRSFPGQGDYGGIAGSSAQSPWIQSDYAEDGSLPERGSGHHEPLPAW